MGPNQVEVYVSKGQQKKSKKTGRLLNIKFANKQAADSFMKAFSNKSKNKNLFTDTMILDENGILKIDVSDLKKLTADVGISQFRAIDYIFEILNFSEIEKNQVLGFLNASTISEKITIQTDKKISQVKDISSNEDFEAELEPSSFRRNAIGSLKENPQEGVQNVKKDRRHGGLVKEILDVELSGVKFSYKNTGKPFARIIVNDPKLPRDVSKSPPDPPPDIVAYIVEMQKDGSYYNQNKDKLFKSFSSEGNLKKLDEIQKKYLSAVDEHEAALSGGDYRENIKSYQKLLQKWKNIKNILVTAIDDEELRKAVVFTSSARLRMSSFSKLILFDMIGYIVQNVQGTDDNAKKLLAVSKSIYNSEKNSNVNDFLEALREKLGVKPKHFNPFEPPSLDDKKIKENQITPGMLSSRIFRAEDTPKQQIKMLETILTDSKLPKQLVFEGEYELYFGEDAKNKIIESLAKNKNINFTHIVSVLVSIKSLGLKLGSYGYDLVRNELIDFEKKLKLVLSKQEEVYRKLSKVESGSSRDVLVKEYNTLVNLLKEFKNEYDNIQKIKISKESENSFLDDFTKTSLMKGFGADVGESVWSSIKKIFNQTLKLEPIIQLESGKSKTENKFKIENEAIKAEIDAQINKLRVLVMSGENKGKLSKDKQDDSFNVQEGQALLETLKSYAEKFEMRNDKLYQKDEILAKALEKSKRYITPYSPMIASMIIAGTAGKLSPNEKIDEAVKPKESANSQAAQMTKVDPKPTIPTPVPAVKPKQSIAPVMAEAVPITPLTRANQPLTTNIPIQSETTSISAPANIADNSMMDNKHATEEQKQEREREREREALRLQALNQAALAATNISTPMQTAQPAYNASSTSEALPASVSVSQAPSNKQTPAADPKPNESTRPVPQAPKKPGPPILMQLNHAKPVRINQHTVSTSSLISYADYKKGCEEAEKILLKNKKENPNNPKYQGVELVQGFSKQQEGKPYVDEVVITSKNLDNENLPHKMVSKFIPTTSPDSTVDKNAPIDPNIKGEIEIRIDPNPDDKILFQAFEFHKSVQNLKLEPGCNAKTILDLVKAANDAGWSIEVMKEGEEDRWVQDVSQVKKNKLGLTESDYKNIEKYSSRLNNMMPRKDNVYNNLINTIVVSEELKPKHNRPGI